MEKFVEFVRPFLGAILAFFSYTLGRTREHENIIKETLGGLDDKKKKIQEKVDNLKSIIPNDWDKLPKRKKTP